MKINTNQTLKSINGELLEIIENSAENKKIPVTFKKVAVEVLLANTDQDKNLTGEDKLRFFRLAEKISANNEVNIPVEDIVLLKERIGRISPTIIVGRMYEILDPKEG